MWLLTNIGENMRLTPYLSIKEGFKNLLNFKGRSGRQDYFWMNILVIILLLCSSGLLFAKPSLIYPAAVVMIFLLLAVTIRRFHDMGMSAWYLVLFLIPVVDMFIVLYLLCVKGEDKKNEYGDDPSGIRVD